MVKSGPYISCEAADNPSTKADSASTPLVPPVADSRQSLSDAQLWHAFRSGDKEALARIYTDHIKPLLNYGQKFIPDQAVVADLVQDLFVEIWHQRERLSTTYSIRYYLLKALRYKIIRHTSRTKNNMIRNGLSDNYHFELVFSHEAQLIQDSIQEDERLKLEMAMSHLTKRQKEAIYLRYYSNLSYEEISSLMDLSEQSAYNLVSRAIRFLKDHLGQKVYLLLIAFLSL